MFKSTKKLSIEQQTHSSTRPFWLALQIIELLKSTKMSKEPAHFNYTNVPLYCPIVDVLGAIQRFRPYDYLVHRTRSIKQLGFQVPTQPINTCPIKKKVFFFFCVTFHKTFCQFWLFFFIHFHPLFTCSFPYCLSANFGCFLFIHSLLVLYLFGFLSILVVFLSSTFIHSLGGLQRGWNWELGNLTAE